VVPVLDEARCLEEMLTDLVGRPGIDEVVVVDGGSTDGSRGIARRVAGVRVLDAPRGRGPQLHAGALAAHGDVLLFLHADARLPEGAATRIRQTLSEPGVVAGAFLTRTRLPPGRRAWFRHVLPLADLRSHYSRHPYGDQALFCFAWAYHQCGGYPDQPLLEDVELARRLRRVGRLVVRREAVEVSARRWAAHPWRTAAVMNTFPMLYRLGVTPERLARWYGAPR
jgi:rSAM/selenodomain-associated transferase 2